MSKVKQKSIKSVNNTSNINRAIVTKEKSGMKPDPKGREYYLQKYHEICEKNKLFDISKYEKMSPIDRTGSSQYFKMRNKETGEFFMGKFLIEKEDLKYMVREIEIHSRVEHRSIIKYIGFSPGEMKDDEKVPTIIMEHCRNYTLDYIFTKIRNKHQITEWNETKKLINLYGIASGMSYFHSLNFMHRNLKPGNIFLDEYLYPKISNFKLSRKYIQSNAMTIGRGAPMFNAPELILSTGTVGNYTKAIDVYSYGLLAYMIMTNDIPFKIKNTMELYSLISEGKRPKFNKPIPIIYKILIQRCWENDPKKRPSFDEIKSIIEDNIDEFVTENVDRKEFLEYIDFINGKIEVIKAPKVFIFEDDQDRQKIQDDLKLNVNIINPQKYKKQINIGQGSFGLVFKVIEKESNKIFACKISKFEMYDRSDEIFINLIREVNILSRLNHPTIMKFIGYSPVNFNNVPKPMIITELFNFSLEEVIELERKSCSLNGWNDTKKLINIYGIASGMLYLHSLGIIHRDLRPGNILLDDFLCPKICDFGLSKEMKEKKRNKNEDDNEEVNNDSGFKGTPAYAAPEIWKNHEYRKEGDVYAFSLIAYEIITNEKPFNDFQVLYQILYFVISQKNRPEFKRPIVKCYQQLIEKCWSDDPNERPSFAQIVEELKNNPEFITDTVDKEEYFDYIDYIDHYFADEIIKSTKNDNKLVEKKSFQKVDLSQYKKIQKISHSSSSNSEEEQIMSLEKEHLVKIEEKEDLIKIEEIESQQNCFIEINDFTRKQLICKSEFSKIYKIKNKKNNEIYSAKVDILNMNKLSKKDIVSISQEINILSKLNHPSIIKFIGYSPVDFKNEPRPVIITEYASNDSLSKIIEKERKGVKIEGWNSTKKLIIIYGIASGMSYLHSHNIIHRNLHSGNILLDEFFYPKIADFVFCTKHNNTLSFNSTCGFKGNPSYLAPEILSSEEYSKAGDVYSFSLILYEILTNSIPFENIKSIVNLINIVVNENKRPEFKKPINKCYKKLIKQCWSSNANERPTFNDIVDEIKNNKEFITNDVIKEDFDKYIKIIDRYLTSFDESVGF